MTIKIGTFKIGRFYVSRGYNGSYMAHVQIGPGAGYRWIDLPGHSHNSAHWFRCRWLYIAGRTFSFGRRVIDRRHGSRTNGRILRWYVGTGNASVYPQW